MPTGLSIAARRALTTLFASFALLCAQLAPVPAASPVEAGTSIAAGHAKAQVARLSGTMTLATADRSAAPHAKSAPPFDALVEHGPRLVLPARHALAFAPDLQASIAAIAALPYRARAPPAGDPADPIIHYS